MHRRYQHTNIPTEIVRTVVAIAETGSFTKAGDRLSLSQPAISAQVKRLQILVGGLVFERTAGGVAFTPRGKLVLSYARKFLEANDQIISLGGGNQDGQPIRVGLGGLYVENFIKLWTAAGIATPVNFVCDTSRELAKGLIEGYLDIACLVNPPSDTDLLFSWEEELVWVRSERFVLSPGAPVPLITWPGGLFDSAMVQALERSGLAYRVVFATQDHHARIAAARAGIGVMFLPRRQVGGDLIVANDYYLPPLEPARAGIAVRASLGRERVNAIIDLLRSLAPQTSNDADAPDADIKADGIKRVRARRIITSAVG